MHMYNMYLQGRESRLKGVRLLGATHTRVIPGGVIQSCNLRSYLDTFVSVWYYVPRLYGVILAISCAIYYSRYRLTGTDPMRSNFSLLIRPVLASICFLTPRLQDLNLTTANKQPFAAKSLPPLDQVLIWCAAIERSYVTNVPKLTFPSRNRDRKATKHETSSWALRPLRKVAIRWTPTRGRLNVMEQKGASNGKDTKPTKSPPAAGASKSPKKRRKVNHGTVHILCQP